jgi:quercetin dioxygenase-like cupin family protein
MRRIVIEAGAVAGRHHHDFEQFLFVAKGGGRLECEAGEIALEPGVGLRLEAGAWHSAEFTDDTVLIEVNLAA